MKTILITGGAGFIGSNFIHYFLNKYSDYKIVNLDALTYAANLDNLKKVEHEPRYIFAEGSICDEDLLESIFKEHDVRGVINFAAESHVDNSISNPSVFVKTNILGTNTLLKVAYAHWMNGPGQFKSVYENSRFHHISTDEVYGSLGSTGMFTESTPYAPNSPYAASKASADMLIRSYNKTYQLNTVITNCSNNYGRYQHDEKLIPKTIKSALDGEQISIYGDGTAIRDWLSVGDHCAGIDVVFHSGVSGEAYNIGGFCEKSVNEIVNMLCNILDEVSPSKNGRSYKKQIKYTADRAGHDMRYAIDATKINNRLEWNATKDFETGLRETVLWYINKFKNTA